uniref:Transmembrane protein 161B n=1 Tax=Strigamia maritima TaxID=126957 RepID=T1JFZ8_STRMM
MAFLGIQLAITMIMASFLQKLAPHFSPARYLLCRKLIRYLHPSDEELRSLSGSGSQTGKGKRKNSKDSRKNGLNGNAPDSTFMVTRKLDIQLDSAKVEPIDVIQLHFYPEFQWLVDFAVCTVVVYIVTEIYYTISKVKDETNLSLLWCVLVLLFALYPFGVRKVLFSVTALYFRGNESTGERMMCITSGFFFFVLSMGILIMSDDVFDFALDNALTKFAENAGVLAKQLGLTSSETNSTSASVMGIRFQLAIFSGVTGAFLTFPGLRLAKMHHDSLRFCAENPILRCFFHLSFISPLFISLMWIKPISRDYFTRHLWPGSTSALMSPDVFETTRLLMIVAVVLLRFVLMPQYLQSYLNMAYDRITELKKEAGKINSLELQRRVARVFYYLCVVALQYVAPLLLCLSFTLLLKSLGDYSWTSYYLSTDSVEPSIQTLPPLNETSPLTVNHLKYVLSSTFYRGLFGFMTWWVCSVWFATSAVGLIYHSYFVQ